MDIDNKLIKLIRALCHDRYSIHVSLFYTPLSVRGDINHDAIAIGIGASSELQGKRPKQIDETRLIQDPSPIDYASSLQMIHPWADYMCQCILSKQRTAKSDRPIHIIHYGSMDIDIDNQYPISLTLK